MKPKEIQELIDFIAHSGLDEVNIETENFKLSVKKSSGAQRTSTESSAYIPQISAPASQPIALSESSAAIEAPVTKIPASGSDDSKYVTIKSPMIGTFYRSANPESPFFVNIGDSIAPGQPICIIEAMKLFNEIEAEISGKVVKILVENASPVEYDQPLFLVDPS